LYDTFGFPSEIIQEIAVEKNIKLDIKKFDKLMDKQKAMSRKASNFEITDASFIPKNLNTSFTGYTDFNGESKVSAIFHRKKSIKSFDEINTNFLVVVESTPFYPEGGGQIADTGVIYNKDCRLDVLNVQKINNVIIHDVILKSGIVSLNDTLTLEIDYDRRKKITINHSSTHLLNQALRDILGDHVEQKGSLVTDEYLRFDFSHNKALTENQIYKIESIISFEINSSRDTTQEKLKYKDAIKNGALAFFDEKYDDEVRVLKIGTKSMELCGGTHITNTSEIRLFKILNETSVSTGIRRIEAITYDKAYNSYQSLFNEKSSLSRILNTQPDKLHDKLSSLKDENEEQIGQIKILNKSLVNLIYKSFNHRETSESKTKIFIEDCSKLNVEQIKILSDLVKTKEANSISILLKEIKSKISCYVGVSKSSKHIYNAKQIVEMINKEFGAKGGGSETFATSIIIGTNHNTVFKFIEKIL